MSDSRLPPLPASNLLVDDEPILILPRLAAHIGLNEAIVLQQVRYWLGKSTNARDGRRWVYNSYEAWQAKNFPFWSVGTVKRIFLALEKAGYLLTATHYNRMPTDRTKWYSIDFAALAALEGALPAAAHRAEADDPTDQFAPMEGRDLIASSDQLDPIDKRNVRHSNQRLPETPPEITPVEDDITPRIRSIAEMRQAVRPRGPGRH